MSNLNRPLRRSTHNRMIAGICGGIAEYFGIDPTLTRVIYVIISLAPPFPGIIMYLILWLIIPEREYY